MILTQADMNERLQDYGIADVVRDLESGGSVEALHVPAGCVSRLIANSSAASDNA